MGLIPRVCQFNRASIFSFLLIGSVAFNITRNPDGHNFTESGRETPAPLARTLALGEAHSPPKSFVELVGPGDANTCDIGHTMGIIFDDSEIAAYALEKGENPAKLAIVDPAPKICKNIWDGKKQCCKQTFFEQIEKQYHRQKQNVEITSKIYQNLGEIYIRPLAGKSDDGEWSSMDALQAEIEEQSSSLLGFMVDAVGAISGKHHHHNHRHHHPHHHKKPSRKDALIADRVLATLSGSSTAEHESPSSDACPKSTVSDIIKDWETCILQVLDMKLERTCGLCDPSSTDSAHGHESWSGQEERPTSEVPQNRADDSKFAACDGITKCLFKAADILWHVSLHLKGMTSRSKAVKSAIQVTSVSAKKLFLYTKVLESKELLEKSHFSAKMQKTGPLFIAADWGDPDAMHPFGDHIALQKEIGTPSDDSDADSESDECQHGEMEDGVCQCDWCWSGKHCDIEKRKGIHYQQIRPIPKAHNAALRVQHCGAPTDSRQTLSRIYLNNNRGCHAPSAKEREMMYHVPSTADSQMYHYSLDTIDLPDGEYLVCHCFHAYCWLSDDRWLEIGKVQVGLASGRDSHTDQEDEDFENVHSEVQKPHARPVEHPTTTVDEAEGSRFHGTVEFSIWCKDGFTDLVGPSALYFDEGGAWMVEDVLKSVDIKNEYYLKKWDFVMPHCVASADSHCRASDWPVLEVGATRDSEFPSHGLPAGGASINFQSGVVTYRCKDPKNVIGIRVSEVFARDLSGLPRAGDMVLKLIEWQGRLVTVAYQHMGLASPVLTKNGRNSSIACPVENPRGKNSASLLQVSANQHNGDFVDGDCNIVKGDHNTIKGDFNRVYGDFNTVEGSCNWVFGYSNAADSHNVINEYVPNDVETDKQCSDWIKKVMHSEGIGSSMWPSDAVREIEKQGKVRSYWWAPGTQIEFACTEPWKKPKTMRCMAIDEMWFGSRWIHELRADLEQSWSNSGPNNVDEQNPKIIALPQALEIPAAEIGKREKIEKDVASKLTKLAQHKNMDSELGYLHEMAIADSQANRADGRSKKPKKLRASARPNNGRSQDMNGVGMAEDNKMQTGEARPNDAGRSHDLNGGGEREKNLQTQVSDAISVRGTNSVTDATSNAGGNSGKVDGLQKNVGENDGNAKPEHSETRQQKSNENDEKRVHSEPGPNSIKNDNQAAKHAEHPTSHFDEQSLDNEKGKKSDGLETTASNAHPQSANSDVSPTSHSDDSTKDISQSSDGEGGKTSDRLEATGANTLQQSAISNVEKHTSHHHHSLKHSPSRKNHKKLKSTHHVERDREHHEGAVIQQVRPRATKRGKRAPIYYAQTYMDPTQ